MKKLFFLLAFLPLFASCNIDGLLDDYFDDLTSLEPTIKNSIDYWAKDQDKTNEEAAALVAVLVEKPAFAGKQGDKLKFQVVLKGSKWGGEPDKLDINYYITGSMTYKSANQVTISVSNYTYLNETWTFTKETKKEDDKDIEWIYLKSGSKSLSLKYHCDKD